MTYQPNFTFSFRYTVILVINLHLATPHDGSYKVKFSFNSEAGPDLLLDEHMKALEHKSLRPVHKLVFRIL